MNIYHIQFTTNYAVNDQWAKIYTWPDSLNIRPFLQISSFITILGCKYCSVCQSVASRRLRF